MPEYELIDLGVAPEVAKGKPLVDEPKAYLRGELYPSQPEYEEVDLGPAPSLPSPPAETIRPKVDPKMLIAARQALSPEVTKEATGLLSRFGRQLWNAAVATPAHVLSKGGDPAEIAAWQAQEKRVARRKETGIKRLVPELLDDEFEDIVRQLRTRQPGARADDDLQDLPQYAPPEITPALAAEVTPAETIPEKAVDVGAGLAGFIAQLAVARQILPVGTPTPIIWETVNQATGGPLGQGAAMAATMGTIGRIPAETIVGKAGRMAVESTLFGGMEALGGGSPEDIAIAASIPPAVRGLGLAKARVLRPKPVEKPITEIKPQPPRGRIRVRAEKFYQDIFNRFASMENITARAIKLGLKIEPGENAKLRARGYLGMGRKAESVLEDKTFRITRKGLIEITGEGLRPILKDFVTKRLAVTIKGKPKRIKTKVLEKDLRDYLVARRTVEDLQRPKYEGSTEFIATPKQVKQAEAKLSGLAKKYGSEQVNILFGKTAERLYAYQKRVLHSLVDSGVFSEQQYQEVLKRNPNYIPFDRIMDAADGTAYIPKRRARFTDARAPVRRIKGSPREVHDPIESIIKNTYRILDVAERNTVARTVVNLQRVFPEEIQHIKIKMRPTKVDPKEISTIIKTFRKQTVPIIKTVEETTRRTAAGEDVSTSGPREKLKKVVKEALQNRGMTEGEAGNYIRALERKATGGEKPTGEIIEKTIKQMIREVRETLIQKEPVETTIFRPSPFKPKGNVIEYFAKGKRKYVEVAPNLYESMSGLNETSAGLLVKIMSKPASWLRIGATITPEFMLRNPIRDQQTALMQTSVGFVPFVDPMRAVSDILGRSDLYYDWLRSGGAYAGFVELSRPQLRVAYKSLMGRKKLLGKLNIISSAQDISILGEQATRLAAYKKALKAGRTPVEAGYESREATVDFGRRGAKTKEINSVLAFFNAGLQGVDKTARQMITHPASTTAKGLTYITIPQLLLYLRNRQDPDYKEQPRWLKDLFYMTKVPDTNVYVTIPKGFLYGQIFGSLPERFFEYVDTQDPAAFDKFADTILDSVLPTSGDPASGILATAVKPIVENITNYNFFTKRPIVPERIAQLEPSEQYMRYTSETAKEVGDIFNYSPAKIENFLRGWYGGSARYALGASDLLINQIKRAEGEEIVEPPKEWTRLPGVAGITRRTAVETGRAESIDKFYRNQTKLNRLQRTYNHMIKTGRRDEARQLKKDNPNMLKVSMFNSRRRTLAEYNRKINRIRARKLLSPEEKDKKIRELQRRKVLLAQKTNKLLE